VNYYNSAYVNATPIGLGFSLPVTIPSDFVGMTAHRWPSGAPLSPTPANNSYGHYRTHDGPGNTKWAQIETSTGVYNWTGLDSIVTAHRTKGATVLFTLYGTPSFYTSSVVVDAYGLTGGAYYPNLDTNLTALKAFITTLITRYNTAGGAWSLANPTLGKGIKYIECWNEFTTTVFWNGTNAQMADICNAIQTAASAIDNTVVILGPSQTIYPINTAFYSTTGPISGKTGLQAISGTSWHWYNIDLYDSTNIFTSKLSPLSIKTQLAAVGINHPLYLTETGSPYNISGGLNSQASWYAASAATRRTRMLKLMMILASVGVKLCSWYSYDDGFQYTFDGVSNFGMASDTTGSYLAISDFNTNIAGKTILSTSINNPGTITLMFSDGTSFTV
jgi:hypothetical protein